MSKSAHVRRMEANLKRWRPIVEGLTQLVTVATGLLALFVAYKACGG